MASSYKSLVQSLALCYFITGIISILAALIIKPLGGLLNHGKESNHIGFYINVKKRRFVDFYLTGLLCAYLSFFTYPSCLLFLFINHLGRRYMETTLIMKYSDSSRMHLLHYICGLSFYPVIIMILIDMEPKVLSKSTTWIFCLLSWLQMHHHYLLGRTRRKGYRAIDQALFRYVYCPHYMIEIILYILLLKQNYSCPLQMLCLVFVSLNLTVSAVNSKRWNIEKFGNSEKAAILPFLI